MGRLFDNRFRKASIWWDFGCHVKAGSGGAYLKSLVMQSYNSNKLTLFNKISGQANFNMTTLTLQSFPMWLDADAIETSWSAFFALCIAQIVLLLVAPAGSPHRFFAVITKFMKASGILGGQTRLNYWKNSVAVSSVAAMCSTIEFAG